MDAYRNAVKFLSENSIENEFSNKGPEHAAIVLEYMLKNTKNEIRFFSGTFNQAVTNDTNFMRELDKYLSSGKKFYLFLEELPSEKNCSSALLKVIEFSRKSPNNIIYKVAPKKFLEELRCRFESGNIYHFTVSDDIAYRVEVGKEDFKAVCNFNDFNISIKLKNVFDKYFF